MLKRWRRTKRTHSQHREQEDYQSKPLHQVDPCVSVEEVNPGRKQTFSRCMKTEKSSLRSEVDLGCLWVCGITQSLHLIAGWNKLFLPGVVLHNSSEFVTTIHTTRNTAVNKYFPGLLLPESFVFTSVSGNCLLCSQQKPADSTISHKVLKLWQ